LRREPGGAPAPCAAAEAVYDRDRPPSFPGSPILFNSSRIRQVVMDIEKTIAQAKALRDSVELVESQELLLALLDEMPDDPRVLFEVGGSYDVMGQEAEAIPLYRRAIANGLQGDQLQECLVCLGSSLRVVGDFADAIGVLEDAAVRFPDNRSSGPFLALAYYNDGQHRKAVQLLLDLLLATTSDEDILSYVEPLDFYREYPDNDWGEES
jgi:tetratricopeptide (TPR) repeat protein